MHCVKFSLVVLFTFTVAASASAATIFNDTFEIASTGSGGRAITDPVADTADINWFTRGNLTANLTVVADGFAGGGTQAMNFDASGTGQIILGAFDADVSDDTVGNSGRLTWLTNVNDRLTLTLTFKFTATPGDNTNGFAFGIFNDPSQFISADNSGAASDDAQGYLALMNTGAAAGVHTVSRESGTNGTVLSGSDLSSLGTGGSGTISATGTNTFRLQLTRSSLSEITVEFFRNNLATPVATGIDNTALYTDFNLFGIRSSSNTDWRIDNVILETSVVPEPATWILAAAGLCGIGFIRRRR